MPDQPGPVTLGLALHKAGRLAEAAALYRAALAADPADAEALHLLGVVADADGDPARAAELICQALTIRETASFRSNLGLVLGHLDRHEEALACFDRALALRPDYPEALLNQGASLEALHRAAEAETSYRRAIAARPGYPEALGNLGNVLRSQNRLDEALAAYEAAVENNPVGPHARLGETLLAPGRTEATEAAFRRDLAARPDDPDARNNLAAIPGETFSPSRSAASPAGRPEAHTNLGQVLHQLGWLEEAVAACERALTLRPDYPAALNNLGNALRGLGRLTESEAALRRAVALRPAEVGGYNNLAITLQAQDRPHEALAVLDLAAALDPGDPETHHHRAMLLLRHGRLREGWDIYDWRLRTRQAGDSHARFANAVPWRGEAIAGRTILLVPEQGFGDMIQFARYAPLVAARGARVILGVPRPLLRLMRTLPGPVELVPVGEAVPRHDLHCPLLSLPRVFGTTLDTVPAAVPYLRAEPEAAARWEARLRASDPGLRIGVVWAGNPRHLNDRQRSLSFAALAPLWRIPGVRWFSLQVGDRAADAAATDAPRPPDGLEDLGPGLTDFAETAAALAALDLVITADTAVAHLAGALGCPVRVLLPHVPDWRWLRSGDRSPWYPTMRLFRQDARRRWEPVVEELAAEMTGLDISGVAALKPEALDAHGLLGHRPARRCG